MANQLLSEFRIYICNELISRFPSHRVRNWFYRKVMGFTIGNRSTVFMHCSFDCTVGFSIGQNSVVNSGCRLDARGGIKIGSNVGISQQVTILTADHDLNFPDFGGRSREVIIDDYAFIGTRAMILPGVIIGKGAIVAAGAVVTKDVAPYTVVAGVPAKAIKERRKDLEYSAEYFRKFQ
jgi:acetyltransferase-like isoleucine patch superfamily enzyme